MDVHELWIEYLREAPRPWSEAVERDFAGCLDGDVKKWIWKANYERGLFFDADENVPTVAEASLVTSPVPGRQLSLVIDLEAGTDDIVAGVLAHVEQWRTEYGWVRAAGRPPFRSDKALYPLATRPDEQALEITLWVLREWKTDEYATYADLGIALLKEFDTLKQTHLPSSSRDTEEEASDKRRLLGSNVERYLKRAQQLISAVAEGVFPVAR